jgi:hypothetical protein
VPAGEYRLAVSLDLSPLFGAVNAETDISVTPPPADILSRRIAELKASDVATRRNALLDLRWFPQEGARVAPAVLAVLDEPDDSIRSAALNTLGSFPKEAAAASDRILALLSVEGAADYVRQSAARLLSRVAPPSKEVEEALAKAVASAEGNARLNYESALASYRRRVTPAAD